MTSSSCVGDLDKIHETEIMKENNLISDIIVNKSHEIFPNSFTIYKCNAIILNTKCTN